MEIKSFLSFLELTEKMKCNTRHSWTSTGRHESVAEHSWQLALMALLVRDEFPDLDMDKVLQMCLLHDLGEAVTGDIPAFVKTSQDELAETDAVEELLSRLPEQQHREFSDLFAEMNAQKSGEAKLYKALDKLEALIQHNQANLSTWLPLEYELQMTYGTKECGFSEYTDHLRKAVREDSRKKIKTAANGSSDGERAEKSGDFHL